MAHEILSVKLYELDNRIMRLCSRIHLSESAGHAQLQQEITDLGRECAEAELSLRERLRRSRSGVAAHLSRTYEKVEDTISASGKELRQSEAGGERPYLSADEKALLAEYALDFAMQAADRALLLSLEAIDAQLTQQEHEEGSPT